jgi:deoxyxylulose-5-phosphate synthase
VLGTPLRFIPHGAPGDIHAALGLDADGLVAAIRQLPS